MLRMIQSRSADHAKAYFTQALAKADYYLSGQDQEIAGRIQGKLAERIGITGSVTKDMFFDLCENINPATGKSLTPLTQTDRTVGYDINFHCPKSVSILHALSKDDHIREAFADATQQTMLDIERDAKTRVRKNGKVAERDTGELIWADFIHQTARPVADHAPDPHLHAHCFVFNATFDEEEKQIKAVQFRDIKRDMPYYQAKFHKRLSDKLIEEGYQIRRTAKSFEVVGVPQRVIDLFSKRTDEIGRIAKDQQITDPNELAELGARTRAKKQQGLTMAELRADWRRQIEALGPGEQGEGERILRYAPPTEKQIITPEQCIDHALSHDFERYSVMQDRKLLATAYRHSIGHQMTTIGQIDEQLEKDSRLIHVEDAKGRLCTTRQVLAEERHMVELAQKGQGVLKPLYTQAPSTKLEGQQADAIRHVLTTPHRVSIIRGAAGSGKTTLMREAVEHIQAAGKKVMVVAPSSEASRGVLRQEGFQDATTVAQLLLDENKQLDLRGQVLWVDEAGLLGTQDMTKLLEITTQQNARIILGGDTRQHASVVRGDALRILNTVGGIQTAEVSKIYRQKDAAYRRVVENLSTGAVAHAFQQLDEIGFIQEVDPKNPNEELVKDYLQAVRGGKSVLVVTPTHQQRDEVTKAIREKLQSAGLLGKKEIKANRLTNLNFTQAQKSDWRNLQPGQRIQFTQNVPGIKRGSLWTVESASDKGVFMYNEHYQHVPLPLDKSGHFELYRHSEMHLAKGDQIRITHNGFDQQKTRLNNGQLLEVIGLGKHGEVRLRNAISKVDYQLDQSYGHWTHAYCLTSHASQGKTVDKVLISQPAATFPGTDAKQFYVSVSRGRQRARIYTDDKEQLLDYARRLGDRQSAMELVSGRNPTNELVQQHIRHEITRTAHQTPAKEPVRPKQPTRIKDRDYEPGI